MLSALIPTTTASLLPERVTPPPGRPVWFYFLQFPPLFQKPRFPVHALLTSGQCPETQPFTATLAQPLSSSARSPSTAEMNSLLSSDRRLPSPELGGSDLHLWTEMKTARGHNSKNTFKRIKPMTRQQIGDRVSNGKISVVPLACFLVTNSRYICCWSRSRVVVFYKGVALQLLFGVSPELFSGHCSRRQSCHAVQMFSRCWAKRSFVFSAESRSIERSLLKQGSLLGIQTELLND